MRNPEKKKEILISIRAMKWSIFWSIVFDIFVWVIVSIMICSHDGYSLVEMWGSILWNTMIDMIHVFIACFAGSAISCIKSIADIYHLRQDINFAMRYLKPAGKGNDDFKDWPY